MIRQNFEIGLTSLLANPLRSFLTMSGIIVGIAAVVAVLAIGKGQEEKIQVEAGKMGANLFWISTRRAFPYGARTPTQILTNSAPTRVESMKVTDADAISKSCTSVEFVAPVVTFFARGSLNGRVTQLNLTGTTPTYLKVRKFKLLAGRYLADEDLRQRNHVCVIEQSAGSTLLFNKENYVDVAGVRLRIVGMVKGRSLQSPQSNTFNIHGPLTVVHERIMGIAEVHTIYCLAHDGAMEDAVRQVHMVMAARAGGASRFEILSTRDLFEGMENLTKIATLVTAGIGTLALFVGGIGIMNILLASVVERTREIGLRKSVGARKRDILFQFLLESITFGVSGGILGVGLGMAVASILTTIIGIPAAFSFEALIVGLGFSITVGIVSGVYPAYKAASLDPIEALRYE